MQRRLDEVRENFTEFVQQPDHAVLLVGCRDHDVAYALKTIEQLDGEDPSSLYICVAEDFADARSYALLVAERLEALYAGMNAALAERGEPQHPPFPPAMTAETTSPRDRIILAIEHLGRRLPNHEAHRIVLALMPLEILAAGAYAAWVLEFTRGDELEPWMKYGRIVARDDAQGTTAGLASDRHAQGVLSCELDFSTEALAADLAQDAVDPSTPLVRRMQALLQLAMIDFSYERHAEAIGKYGVVFDFYGKSNQPVMQAMCLQGVGDSLRASGRHEDAQVRYQQGLATVMRTIGEDGKLDPSAPPVLLNLLMAAGDNAMDLKLYADASSYYQDAGRTAARCLNAGTAADAIERAGDAELARGDRAAALQAWKDAEAIAEKYHDHGRMQSTAQRQSQLYKNAGMNRDARQLARKADGAGVLAKRAAS